MNMKKRFIIILLLYIAAYPVHNIFAAQDIDVRYTVHNFAKDVSGTFGLDHTERNYRATNSGATQVCIFCHTPHNATPSVPLWNKAYDSAIASTYRLYTSSATLSNTVKNSSITATSESMLCLSCHDGKTAINVLHNSKVRDATNSNGDAIVNVGFGPVESSFGTIWNTIQGDYPSNLGAIRDSDGSISSAANASNGTNLTDDHPIGFSYQSVLGEAGKSNSLNTLADAKNSGLRFYGPNRDRVECSSCHNPHVFYGYGLNGSNRVLLTRAGLIPTQAQMDRTPFLVRDNNGSALCLGCHKK